MISFWFSANFSNNSLRAFIFRYQQFNSLQIRKITIYARKTREKLLFPVWIELLHEQVVVGGEGEDVAEGGIVLRILAAGMGIEQEGESAVIIGERSRHAGQVGRTETADSDTEFGYLEFLVVERLLLKHLQHHGHLLGRGTLDTRRATLLIGRRIAGTMGMVGRRMTLRGDGQADQQEQEEGKKMFHR